jgi:PAS domain S-box-containing protein
MDVNESFLKVLGYERDDIVNHNLYGLNLLLQTEKSRLAIAQLRAGQPVAATEVTLRTKTGGLRTVLAAAEPLQFFGKPSALATYVDITERKETEEQLMKAIQAAVQDAASFSRSIMEKLLQIRSGASETTELAELTDRERQVLVLVAKGWNNHRIAAELGLRRQTVNNYLSRIYEKLNVRSRAEVIIWARQRGLIELE